ncbi:23871_t:CDS:2, partial [Gigaspora rosea]
NLYLLIKAEHGLDQCTYNTLTASQVAAIWIEGNNPVDSMNRDVIVESNREDYNASLKLAVHHSWHPGDYRFGLVGWPLCIAVKFPYFLPHH